MKVSDMRASYDVPVDNTLVQTFSGALSHPLHGECFCIIYRAVRNDSGIAREATIRQLKQHEPNVGFWTGDVIQYFDQHGALLEEVK